MATDESGAPVIDFTARDFSTVRQRLLELIQQRFPRSWRDLTESQVAIAIMEIISWSHDVHGFYMDRIANESFLPTAQRLDSVIDHGASVGYKLRPATAASATITATLSSVQPTDLIIEAGTSFTSGSGVKFEFLENFRLPANSLSNVDTIYAVEGSTNVEETRGTGAAYQNITTSLGPVINGSITVTVAGEVWTEVDSLTLASAENVYEVSYDDSGKAIISFGNGIFGNVPLAGYSIVVNYRVGGGTKGNVAAGDINTQVRALKDGSDPAAYAYVSITNLVRGSGGNASETLKEGKVNIPRFVQANDRAVTGNNSISDDYAALAVAFRSDEAGSITYAKSRIKQEVPELNTLELIMWARDEINRVVGVDPSSELAIAILDYLEGKKTTCTRMEAVAGDVLYVDFFYLLTMYAGFPLTTAVNEIQTAVQDRFNTVDIYPGGWVHLSDYYRIADSASGVDYARVSQIVGSKLQTYVVPGFIGVDVMITLPHDDNLIPGSVVVSVNAVSASDDRDGSMEGNIDPLFAHTVDYETGFLTMKWAESQSGDLTVEYRTIAHRDVQADVFVGDTTIMSPAKYKFRLEENIVPGTLVIEVFTTANKRRYKLVDNGAGGFTESTLTETAAEGDSCLVIPVYSFVLGPESTPGTVVVSILDSDGDVRYSFTDDGTGLFTAPALAGADNTINYVSGAVNLHFAGGFREKIDSPSGPFTVGETVNGGLAKILGVETVGPDTYLYLNFEVAVGETITGDVSGESGTVDAVEPTNPQTGETISVNYAVAPALTSPSSVVYETGNVTLTFLNPRRPMNGQQGRATYTRQLIAVSGDLPVSDLEVAVLGQVNVERA